MNSSRTEATPRMLAKPPEHLAESQHTPLVLPSMAPQVPVTQPGAELRDFSPDARLPEFSASGGGNLQTEGHFDSSLRTIFCPFYFPNTSQVTAVLSTPTLFLTPAHCPLDAVTPASPLASTHCQTTVTFSRMLQTKSPLLSTNLPPCDS